MGTPIRQARHLDAKKGIDVENVWKDIQNLGPTNILTFRDGQNLVKIWIE